MSENIGSHAGLTVAASMIRFASARPARSVSTSVDNTGRDGLKLNQSTTATDAGADTPGAEDSTVLSLARFTCRMEKVG